MDLTLRNAEVNQMSLALELFRKTSLSLKERNLSQWSYWSDPPQEKIQWVREGFEKGEFYFVYDSQEKLVGMFRLLHVDELYWDEKGKDENTRYIHSLVVTPEYSGKGIGADILVDVIGKLRNQGVKFLRLDCDSSNSRLCRYYEDQGFIKAGEKITPYSVNNLYEMKLRLRG